MLRLTLRSVVASTLLGAAAIHAAQAPSHLAEWWAAGIAFMVMAAVQALLGAAALRTDRWLWQLAQAVSLATLGLWVLSRTVGLPVGPEAGLPEPVGRAESDVDRLRQAGYTDVDILHIAELTAIFNYNGRLANGLGLVANQQYHELGRAPRASDERPGRRTSARAGSRPPRRRRPATTPTRTWRGRPRSPAPQARAAAAS